MYPPSCHLPRQEVDQQLMSLTALKVQTFVVRGPCPSAACAKPSTFLAKLDMTQEHTSHLILAADCLVDAAQHTRCAGEEQPHLH
eukprot:4040683-Amphidinium_carterae.2